MVEQNGQGINPWTCELLLRSVGWLSSDTKFGDAGHDTPPNVSFKLEARFGPCQASRAEEAKEEKDGRSTGTSQVPWIASPLSPFLFSGRVPRLK